MWLWRNARRARWEHDRDPENPEHVGEAAKDVSLRNERGELGLSVFRVETTAEAQRVAILYASTLLDRPGKLDYMMAPSQCFENLELVVSHRPVEGLYPYLSERHYEVMGLDESVSLALARELLASPERVVVRIRESELIAELRKLMVKEPLLHHFVGEAWRNLL